MFWASLKTTTFSTTSSICQKRRSEEVVQTGLLHNLRMFLMELGDGFAFVGEKMRVQVGNQDFELDLLFYHRDLQCLVAFELKTVRFEPEHLDKLAFLPGGA